MQGHDRTGLILEIFGERAATAEGRSASSWHPYQAGRWSAADPPGGSAGLRLPAGGKPIEADRRLIRPHGSDQA
jgi:50S ribosomal subunit-associated GTPase HflX